MAWAGTGGSGLPEWQIRPKITTNSNEFYS